MFFVYNLILVGSDLPAGKRRLLVGSHQINFVQGDQQFSVDRVICGQQQLPWRDCLRFYVGNLYRGIVSPLHRELDYVCEMELSCLGIRLREGLDCVH